ncbi:MAG TPA: hypothetical protein VMU59_05710 [Caulobacteraceae bacterium]|nr:hypothetical protein [Caulobacteraceae bacterium]
MTSAQTEAGMLIERTDRNAAAEIEDAKSDLLQAIALLKAIDEGQLLGAAPDDLAARKRHEAGVTLLAMVEPRLERALLRLRLAD